LERKGGKKINASLFIYKVAPFARDGEGKRKNSWLAFAHWERGEEVVCYREEIL